MMIMERMSVEEKEVEIGRLKQLKLEEKKLNKLKSIQTQICLVRMDMRIKSSLRADSEKADIDRCCRLMEDLNKLTVTQQNLFMAPEIVETMRKCRKYKNSELVCKLANECYTKMMELFPAAQPGETFATIFDKLRDKYLQENADEVKRERSLAHRLIKAALAYSPTNVVS